jgi:hypothetical protein
VALALWKSTSGAFYTGLLNLNWPHVYKARETNGEQERETRFDGEHARRNFFCAAHQTIQSRATWQVLYSLLCSRAAGKLRLKTGLQATGVVLD